MLFWCKFCLTAGHQLSIVRNFSLESWPSGRRRSPAKGVYGQNLYQGFESLTLRHIQKIPEFNSGIFYLLVLTAEITVYLLVNLISLAVYLYIS